MVWNCFFNSQKKSQSPTVCFTRATQTFYLKLLLHRKQKADTKVQELHFDFNQQEVNTRNQRKPIDCQQLEKSWCHGQWLSLRHRRGFRFKAQSLVSAAGTQAAALHMIGQINFLQTLQVWIFFFYKTKKIKIYDHQSGDMTETKQTCLQQLEWNCVKNLGGFSATVFWMAVDNTKSARNSENWK